MTELPEGWAWATVDDLAETSLGKMLDAKRQTGAHPTPYLRNINVRWGGFDLGDVAEMDIAPHELDRVLAQPGDVIVCEGGEPGRAAVWRGQPVALQKALHRIRPVAGVSPDYLAFSLRSAASTKQLDRLFTGTTIKHLPQEKLRQVPVPLAPSAEQDRIVAAIAEAFSKLDAGEAGLGTVRQLLKRLRDTILAAAVTGRLVPQDPTDAPTGRLLADHSIEEISPADAPMLPTGWCWAELGDAAFDSGYGTSVRCTYDADGPGVLRIPNIRAGRVDLTDLKRAPLSAGLEESIFLEPGDLLIVRTNGSRDLIGRCAAVTASLGCSFASYLIRFRLRTDLLSASFASRQLVAQWWRLRLESMAASSAGQYNLSLRGLSPLPMAVPPLAEQGRIVAEVERQLSFVEACERAVEVGLARSAALRRSVLKAAVDGRLVPQDPSDEPATILLNRIRAERSAQPAARQRTRQSA